MSGVRSERWPPRCPPASARSTSLVGGARAYLRAAETDEDLRRIGLVQSRAVLGWEGWREAATELGIGLILAGVTAAIEAGELPRRRPEIDCPTSCWRR